MYTVPFNAPELEKLSGWAAELVQQAANLRERGVDPTSDEVRDFSGAVETLAEGYEMLVSELNMRELGRELDAPW